MENEFNWISFNNWIIGGFYEERDIDNNITFLGELKNKSLKGFSYDPFMKMVFEKDGIEYIYIIQNCMVYRKI